MSTFCVFIASDMDRGSLRKGRNAGRTGSKSYKLQVHLLSPAQLELQSRSVFDFSINLEPTEDELQQEHSSMDPHYKNT